MQNILKGKYGVHSHSSIIGRQKTVNVYSCFLKLVIIRVTRSSIKCLLCQALLFRVSPINNRFLPVGLKSNLWERQGTPYVYGSSGLSCSGGSTRNRIVGVRTHPHRVAYPTQTHHWASGWHPVTKAIQKPTHLPSLGLFRLRPTFWALCLFRSNIYKDLMTVNIGSGVIVYIFMFLSPVDRLSYILLFW